jgi:hypothetical protein
MINLAGNHLCDRYISKELRTAHIEAVYYKNTSEVPSLIQGRFLHYFFTRAWVYWIVSGITSYRLSLLLYNRSKEIEKGQYGYPVRVNGDCSCPKPEGKVDCWHIDTQEGLNEFVKIINLNR